MGKNPGRKKGGVLQLQTPKVKHKPKLAVFLLGKTSQRITMNASKRHRKRLRVFLGKQ
jgi:hypothetical protein